MVGVRGFESLTAPYFTNPGFFLRTWGFFYRPNQNNTRLLDA